MKQIKHVEADGSGAMLHENIVGGPILTMRLPAAELPTNTYHFSAKLTLTDIYGALVTLERSIHTVAEGLRAQIEEGG